MAHFYAFNQVPCPSAAERDQADQRATEGPEGQRRADVQRSRGEGVRRLLQEDGVPETTLLARFLPRGHPGAQKVRSNRMEHPLRVDELRFRNLSETTHGNQASSLHTRSTIGYQIYLNEQPDVPWETLNYLISEINYGGRVTDDKDVRLITALLRKYFNPKIMEDKYAFSASGVYHTPENLELAKVREQIEALPAEDDPEVFGLHANASITFEQKTVKEFFDTLLLSQPRSSGKSASGESPDEIVLKLAEKILSELPEPIEEVRMDNPNSLDVFRFQEVLQFNKLLSTMKKTLMDLKKAIKGLVVMSFTLEKMFDSFILKRVPANWEKVAYPSLKPLGSWITDLVHRIAFFKVWVKQGQVPSYWISAMFFPQGFMTSALQTYARKTMIAIDTLTFRTEIRTVKAEDCKEGPEIGVNLHGLFIEGCGWNVNKTQLQESAQKQLFVEMPVLWLEPIKTDKYDPKNTYKCPLYKTSTRRGNLSTTGHSTNFVMYMDLKTEEDHEHWIRRGVALLCQLDD